MKITRSMMNKALMDYEQADYAFHFKEYDPADPEMLSNLSKAMESYAKEAYGKEILAFMKTNISPVELGQRGYVITESFVYFDEGNPIYIESIKDCSKRQGIITIEYTNGGKKDYEGGTFYEELFNLLCHLKQEDALLERMDPHHAMIEALLTYYDDGGFQFVLASRVNPQVVKRLQDKINHQEILGILDSSVLKNGTQGFYTTQDHIYSPYFESHKQDPIDLNIIDHVEVKSNKLLIYHKDSSKRAVYVSVYGNDLEHLITLYLKLVHKTD